MNPPLAEPVLLPKHKESLAQAVRLLEQTSFATQLAEYTGQPVNRFLRMTPRPLNAGLRRVVEIAIVKSLDVAIKSMKATSKRSPATTLLVLFAGVSGGVSGFLGVAALPVELPVTTTLMLRAIADIARHHGEDLSTLEGRLACIEVFALGANGSKGRMDVGYYASRALMSKFASDASTFVLERGVASASAPLVNRFATEIASRFGVVVSERIAAGAIPIVGALGGAAVNAIFMHHFQNIARGHFIIRGLERVYGAETIRSHYMNLLAQRPRSKPRLRA